LPTSQSRAALAYKGPGSPEIVGNRRKIGDQKTI